MKNQKPTEGDSVKFKSRLTLLYATLVIIYAGLLFCIPPSPALLEKYHISLVTLRLINVAVIIPYVFIWLAGFYGYAKLKNYSVGIRQSKDGEQVNKIADGILLLVLWPPFSSILATLGSQMAAEHPSLKAADVIVNNYFNMLWPLIGFLLIAAGSRGLIQTSKIYHTSRALNRLGLLLIGLGVAFVSLIWSAVNRADNTYPWPNWVFMATLVVPYIYTWFIGLLATYEIYRYSHKVTGIVYRKSWGLLALGIGAIIVMQIIVQYANALASQLSKLALSWYVGVIYAVLILLSVGYILVARGAKRLQKIEEV